MWRDWCQWRSTIFYCSGNNYSAKLIGKSGLLHVKLKPEASGNDVTESGEIWLSKDYNKHRTSVQQAVDADPFEWKIQATFFTHRWLLGRGGSYKNDMKYKYSGRWTDVMIQEMQVYQCFNESEMTDPLWSWKWHESHCMCTEGKWWPLWWKPNCPFPRCSWNVDMINIWLYWYSYSTEFDIPAMRTSHSINRYFLPVLSIKLKSEGGPTLVFTTGKSRR